MLTLVLIFGILPVSSLNAYAATEARTLPINSYISYTNNVAQFGTYDDYL